MNAIFDRDFVYQQDNAPCHKSKQTMKFFKDNGIVVIEWPPNSPNLKPIEHLWGIIKDILEKEEPKTFQLWVAKINETRDNFKLDVLELLNKSMKERTEQCIAAKGDRIKL
jgi:transposase